MMTIKLGGVPEHFNLPILLAVESGKFEECGVQLEWEYFPGGTGAMTRALADEKLDLAILLTEGFVAAAAGGLKAKIVKTYIESPLVWGIYTGRQSQTRSLYDRTAKRYAISRFGSGSHLMAMIHAEQRGEKLEDDAFVVVNSIEGGIASLEAGETQVFYWEKLMTKTYVDQKKVRLIGTFSAPWSGFLIVAADKALEEKSAAIRQVMEVINAAAERFRSDSGSEVLLQQRFNLTREDIAEWLPNTVWNEGFSVNRRGLQHAIDAVARIVPMNPLMLTEQLMYRFQD